MDTSDGSDSAYLYRQGYDALYGGADEYIQNMYDSHIILLMQRKLGQYMSDIDIGMMINKYIYDPKVVSMILDDQIKGIPKDQIQVSEEEPLNE